MSAPNLLSLTTITAKTVQGQCTDSLVELIGNSAASGKVLKVNTILAANISAVFTAASVSVAIVRSATTRYLAFAATIPGAASLVLLENTPIYLEEGDSLQIKSSPSTGVEVTASYEEIS